MILTALMAFTKITDNNLPTQLFLTSINHMIGMINMSRNAMSQPINPEVEVSGNTVTISPHTRVFMDGSTQEIPGGTINQTLPSTFWVVRDTDYKIATTQPVQGKLSVIGYWNGSMFTSYRIGNV